MTVAKHAIRAGTYYDSLVLMQLQRALLGLPGVIDAGVVMATPANRDLLAASQLLPADIACSPDDLLIVVKAENEKIALAALGQVDELLARRRAVGDQEFRPHSLEAAVRQMPQAGWVLISVPGRYATGVARQALDFGRHVFLYSDNVPVADEFALKQTAREKGLLIMGPDCGTSIINGIGLGFSNHVRRGPIGMIGSSGTGLQAISARIHELGSGISHAIGTGSRDLHSEIGALTTLQALQVLNDDSDTGVIVLISKPPASEVAMRMLASAQAVGKSVVVDFIGFPHPAASLGNLHFASTLSETAQLAVNLASVTLPTQETRKRYKGYVRGLFSGGTLAYETMLGLQAVLAPLYSNVPITPEQKLKDAFQSERHSIIDLGDELFMVGRLHPMIDNDLRIRRLKQEAADPEVGLILLDVVLGEGSHPDPAGELAPVIREIRRNTDIEFVVVLIGTETDPQNLEAQSAKFSGAGAQVFRNLTEALEHITRHMQPEPAIRGPKVQMDFFKKPVAAINVGIESFYASLRAQGAEAVQVDWRPSAGGDERLAGILARMKG